MKDYIESIDQWYAEKSIAHPTSSLAGDVTVRAADKAVRSSGLYARFGKRLFDVALALLLLPVLAPIIALLWVVARRDGGATGFFGHNRIGLNGNTFRCWKIRTMVEGAEEKLGAYLAKNPEAAVEWERDHKLTNDPRITPIGDFMRKTSLDELPQIWNVLTGEMSFVGPRPIVRKELAKYGSAASVYLVQKPGITGLWQVSGRNDVSYDERVEMDVEYVGRSSFAFDIELILKTGLSVLGKTGR